MKKERTMSGSEGQFKQLVAQLQQVPSLVEQLPPDEAALVRDALAGMNVYELAQQHRMSESAVWNAISSASRQASGNVVPQVEVGGGLGSDPSPGEDA
jgi:DNA-directed RNA polymerase specialized sigma24 family protein